MTIATPLSLYIYIHKAVRFKNVLSLSLSLSINDHYNYEKRNGEYREITKTRLFLTMKF